jgi:hypothetical protein
MSYAISLVQLIYVYTLQEGEGALSSLLFRFVPLRVTHSPGCRRPCSTRHPHSRHLGSRAFQ